MITQRDYFNDMAETWDEHCHHDPVKINRLLNMLDIQKGSACLDVGTGTGVLIPYLLNRVGEEGIIVAIDLSDKMLKVAQGKYAYPNVNFVCGDVLEGGLPGGAFDAVVCYSVFPHFTDKLAAVRILSQNLKKGGKLLIGHSQSREHINRMHMNAPQAVAGDSLPDMVTIRAYMEAAGMKVLGWVDDEAMFAAVAGK